MARTALLVSLLTLAPLFTLLPASTALDFGCRAPAAADSLDPLTSLPGLPPGWSASLALDHARMPPVPTVVASNGARTCDLTHGLASFVRAAGPVDAEQRAVLAAAVLYPDVLGLPQPVAVSSEASAVSLETWSAKDGLVVDWTIDPVTLEARFVVRDVAVGVFVAEVEGRHVGVGDTETDAQGQDGPEAQATLVLMCPNPDGSAFRITYDTARYASPTEADDYAGYYCDAAKAQYAIQVIAWGFTSVDPDQVFDITNDGCTCIFGGDEVDIHLHPKIETLTASLGLTYPSNGAIYRSIIGHEFHHHLQWSINAWSTTTALIEGGARFSETIVEPVGVHQAGSLVYHRSVNGFPNYMTSPNTALRSRLYDAGLLWGYLYGNEGGLPFLKALYAQAAGTTDVPAAVTRAMGDVGSTTHANFDAAYDDFALAMLRREFLWGQPDGSDVRDWGLFLPPVTRIGFFTPGGGLSEVQGAANARGLAFARTAPGATMETHFVATDAAVKGRWIGHRADGTFVVQPATQSATLAGGPFVDVTLVVTRGFFPLNVLGTDTSGAYVATLQRS